MSHPAVATGPLPPAVLAEARMELERFDLLRFEKFGNIGATRGRQHRVKPTRSLSLVRPAATRQATAPAIELGPITVPELHPCPGGCGHFIGDKEARHLCTRCRRKRIGERPCAGGCGAIVTVKPRCARCQRAWLAERHPPCACGRPYYKRGLCQTHYTVAQTRRDPIYAEKVRRTRARAARERAARARGEQATR